jgi:CRP/FNR family cyclic AMP-dependent transcriptional regulator
MEYSHSKPHNQLFNDLNEKELKTLFSISSETILEPGQYLIREGEASNEMYIIMEGSLEILKKDPSGESFTIGHLGKGDSVGELGILDQEIRSASVMATTHVVLRKIYIQTLSQKLAEDPSFLSIYERLARNMSRKLRTTSEKTVDALKKQLEEFKQRTVLGQFLISIVVFLSFLIFLLKPLNYAIRNASSTTSVSVPMIAILTVLILLFMRFSRLPLETFGLTLKNWKRSLYEGILYSIPFMLVPTFIKLGMIYFIPSYQEHDLFEPFALITDPANHTIKFWILINTIYWLFVPAQELMARGALQGPLANFLTGKRKVLVSILVSNLIFSTAHVYISELVAIAALIGGLFQGWLYSRSHNLIGVTVSHAILGTWTLGVLGP